MGVFEAQDFFQGYSKHALQSPSIRKNAEFFGSSPVSSSGETSISGSCSSSLRAGRGVASVVIGAARGSPVYLLPFMDEVLPSPPLPPFQPTTQAPFSLKFDVGFDNVSIKVSIRVNGQWFDHSRVELQRRCLNFPAEIEYHQIGIPIHAIDGTCDEYFSRPPGRKLPFPSQSPLPLHPGLDVTQYSKDPNPYATTLGDCED